MATPRLILVGGGHAHLLVLETLHRDDWPPVHCMLVSPEPKALYSGMVPGYLQGTYSESEIGVDLPALCAKCGVEWRPGWVDGVDGEQRTVSVAGEILPFDLLSLDIGSVPAGAHLPGVERYAAGIRPLQRIRSLRDRVDQIVLDMERGHREVRVVVVGAGAGGFELALATQRRFSSRGILPRMTIVGSEPQLLSGYSDRVQRLGKKVLRHRGIELRSDLKVVEVTAEAVYGRDGESLPADLVIWATGPAAPGMLRRSGLPVDEDGYLRVDTTLRSVDGAPIWGAGDCVSIRGADVPRAGVFAVREGPVLAANLRAAIEGSPPRAYEPQSSYLSLLNTADGRAILRRGPIALHSGWAWWLKDRIDRHWIARFR